MTLDLRIPGLDLVLGGGVQLVSRQSADSGSEGSAVLLLRGQPGAGKTIFGSHLALELGRRLKSDVAYGCIEILPTELRAQLANFDFSADVEVPPYRHRLAGAPAPVFCASVLELPGPRPAIRVASAVESLRNVIQSATSRLPRIVVVDSLSEGHGLGPDTPRSLADGICKYALAHGLVLILLEEADDDRASAWSYAADVVVELGQARRPGTADPAERELSIAKNRFGPCDPGPHAFEIEASGVRVFPRPSAYLRSWAQEVVLRTAGGQKPDLAQRWSFETMDDEKWLPAFRDSVTAVFGSDSHLVQHVARMLGSRTAGPAPATGLDLLLDFSSTIPRNAEESDGAMRIGAGDPYQSGARLLATVREALGTLAARPIRRVLIGDCRALKWFRNSDGWRRAIMVLCAILKRMRVPVVLFETYTRTRWRSVVTGGPFPAPDQVEDETGAQEPWVVDAADVVIELRSTGPQAVVTCASRGVQHVLIMKAPPDASSNRESS